MPQESPPTKGATAWPQRMLFGVFFFVILLALAAYLFLPGAIMRRLNRTVQPGPYRPSPEAQALHSQLFVADLHCDSLLWGANLSKRQSKGHIDIPRLLEGNVGLQVFAACTYVPARNNLERTPMGRDILPLLHILQGCPFATWFSPRERVLYLARRLDAFAAANPDRFRVIRFREDLAAYEAQRQSGQPATAGLLSIEGLYCLQGDLENMRVFFHAGYRLMSLTHFPDSDLGGSAHGVEKGGLTDYGRRAVRFMEELGVLVDVAHASPKLIDDILAIATKPVILSHGGAQGAHPSIRNLSDAHLQGIAETGGLIGVGFWKHAVGEASVAAIVDALAYVAEVAGIDHVALGSDFDGVVTTPFDASGMALITEGLLNRGLREDAIRKIMGENVLRVLRAQLPPKNRPTDQSVIPIPQ